MAYPETRKERLAREQWMKNNSMAEEIPTTPIVKIAGPTTEEGFLATAPDYAKDMSFIQQPKPEPNVLEQAGAWAGESALGKMGSAGWDKGTGMLKNWWGRLAMPKTAGGAAANVVGNPGVMSKLGAAVGGAGSGLAAMAGPIGLGLIGAKMLGLFNKGGAVGPLSPQYKKGGDYIGEPWKENSLNSALRAGSEGLSEAMQQNYLMNLLGPLSRQPTKVEKKETIQY